MSVPVPSYQWIGDSAELAALCESLQRQAAIALDTEFIRTNTYYPKTALLQVATESNAYLIDPLSIKNFDPFRDLLQNRNVVKVLHSCSEDLEVCKVFFGALPDPVFDTQVAAAVANIGFSLSYSALVERLVGVDLPKGETRSDWLARPLRREQEHYAILDVVYLLPLYRTLQAQLEEKQRLDWLREECAELVSNAGITLEPDDYYKKIKAAWKLNQQQLAVLRALASWRETRARELDKPRNHIVPEKVLLEAAKSLAETPEKVKQLMTGPLGRYRKQAQPVAAIVRETLADEHLHALPKFPKPLPLKSKHLVKDIKLAAQQISEREEIPIEILLKKADIEDFVRTGNNGDDYHLPQRLRGWRQAVVGDEILAIANRTRVQDQ